MARRRGSSFFAFFKTFFHKPIRKRKGLLSRKPFLEILEDRSLPSASAVSSALFQFSEAQPWMDNWSWWAEKSGVQVVDTGVDHLYEATGPSRAVEKLGRFLQRNPRLEYFESNFTITTALAPNDPRFTDDTLWGLNGTNGINAPTAWDTTTGSTTQTVAVIDSGVDYRHKDLYQNIWINQGEIPTSIKNALTDTDSDGIITFYDLNQSVNQGTGKISDHDGDGRITGGDLIHNSSGWEDGSDTDGNGYTDDLIGWDYVGNDNDPNDGNSHGTHVAGTIGALGNNSEGVVGVNWKVLLMPVRFLNTSGSGSTSNAALSVRYSADNGANISNNSWGGGGFSTTLYNAINYAKSKGHLFVAAAGNSASNNDSMGFYPSNYNLDNILAIASTDSDGGISSYSSYGATTVDIGAPGRNIYSTTPNNGYGYKSGTSMATPHVAGVAALVWSQQSSWSYSQVISQLMDTATEASELNGKTVSGGIVNAGEAVANGPEITVTGSSNVVDGGTVNMGSAFAGQSITKTFTVKNDGTDDLTLGTITVNGSAFSLQSGFGDTTLAAGATTTFAVKLNAQETTGTYNGTVSIGNNDENENPFDFAVSGTVENSKIIDNGDSGFSTSGEWTLWNNQGNQGDVHESLPGNGNDIATWTFGVTPGQYKVSATWTTWSNRATNAPFTIHNGSSQVGFVQVNQKHSPNDFSESGVSWDNLGTFTITGNTLVVKLSDNADGRLNADAIRIEWAGQMQTGPEIQVTDGNDDITDGSGTVNYGNTQLGSAISKTLTVKNVGNEDLTLGSTINVPTGFTVTSGFGQTILAAGEFTTFTVRLDATANGSYSGELSFNTNDSDENPFSFSVAGTVATIQIMDNGDSGFSTTGAWTRWTGQGNQGDVHESLPGSGDDIASWTFAVAPGQYKVAATWTTWSNRATNAPFTVYNGNTQVGSLQVNQKDSPNDFSESGVSWENLGTLTITGNTLVVTLSDNADGRLNADAIRIEWVGQIPTGPEIEVSVESSDIADGNGSVDFGNTSAGNPVSKTFTVKNVGTDDLILGSTLNVPTGYTVTSGFTQTTLSAGESTTFTVRLNATANGSYGGEVSFSTNDSDENPFNFSVAGTVSTVQIIDDGDSGFTTSGEWTLWSNQGNQGDVHESLSGNGDDVATWSFDVTPGQYKVAATWTVWTNRATNAPFAVYNGSSLLGAVQLNQQIAPNDFSDSGVLWENLGTFTISGNALVVKLSDNANGRLNADAIRIESV